MTWIDVHNPDSHPDVACALRDACASYPSEYAPHRRGERDLPPIVADDNIILVHSLIPEALRHMVGGLGALFAPELPLSRRDHELIAATTSALNQCFY
jgi:alkylhydroperoxidase family enzyme